MKGRVLYYIQGSSAQWNGNHVATTIPLSTRIGIDTSSYVKPCYDGEFWYLTRLRSYIYILQVTWVNIPSFPRSYFAPRMSLSYREFIECRYIGLFRISKSISLLLGHWYEIMALYYVKSILTEISASRQERRVLQKSKIIRIEFLSKWGML